jgi:glycosyltransferase involved in cell wall biosynthesis
LKSKPTVSVILPVYNGENYLRFAIESVLEQTIPDYELIVIDDGSVDSTPDIVRAYDVPQIRYVRQENTGVSGAFNHGLRLAQGRYISWLSHDDVFMPSKLEKQVNAISNASEPSVCYTDIQMIDSDGKVFLDRRLPDSSREDALRNVLTGGLICSASYSILYDRRCIEEVGMYSMVWRYAQDVDMLARLAQRFRLIHVPEFLMQVREHTARGIRSKNWEREITRYFAEQLNSTSIEELFPDTKPVTRVERARAFLWLADRLASFPIPAYQKIARGQYLRALSEYPAIIPKLTVHYVCSLFAAFRLGSRAVLAHPEMLIGLIKSHD